MVRTIFTLSLLGLGTVHALPAQQLQDRQIFGGGGASGGSLVPGGGESSGSLIPGGNAGTFCDYNKPFEEQQGCTVLGGPGIFSGGTFLPPKDKRDSSEAEQLLRHVKRDIALSKDCDLKKLEWVFSLLSQLNGDFLIGRSDLITQLIKPTFDKCGIPYDTPFLVPGGSTGSIVPQPTIPGGSMVPEKPSSGGSLVPEKPSGGGSMIPSEPYVPGGSLVPENPSGGGSMYPSP